MWEQLQWGAWFGAPGRAGSCPPNSTSQLDLLFPSAGKGLGLSPTDAFM